jgi:hypothetical protein
MKYDPVELIKLGISEESIQKNRDAILKALTETKDGLDAALVIDPIFLPFVIDMLKGYAFEIAPFSHWVRLTIKLRTQQVL